MLLMDLAKDKCLRSSRRRLAFWASMRFDEASRQPLQTLLKHSANHLQTLLKHPFNRRPACLALVRHHVRSSKDRSANYNTIPPQALLQTRLFPAPRRLLSRWSTTSSSPDLHMAKLFTPGDDRLAHLRSSTSSSLASSRHTRSISISLSRYAS